jgi:hypothetical protein
MPRRIARGASLFGETPLAVVHLPFPLLFLLYARIRIYCPLSPTTSDKSVCLLAKGEKRGIYNVTTDPQYPFILHTFSPRACTRRLSLFSLSVLSPLNTLSPRRLLHPPSPQPRDRNRVIYACTLFVSKTARRLLSVPAAAAAAAAPPPPLSLGSLLRATSLSYVDFFGGIRDYLGATEPVLTRRYGQEGFGAIRGHVRATLDQFTSAVGLRRHLEKKTELLLAPTPARAPFFRATWMLYVLARGAQPRIGGEEDSLVRDVSGPSHLFALCMQLLDFVLLIAFASLFICPSASSQERTYMCMISAGRPLAPAAAPLVPAPLSHTYILISCVYNSHRSSSWAAP